MTEARDIIRAAEVLAQQQTGRNLDRSVEIILDDLNCADSEVAIYGQWLLENQTSRIHVLDRRGSHETPG